MLWRREWKPWRGVCRLAYQRVMFSRASPAAGTRGRRTICPWGVSRGGGMAVWRRPSMDKHDQALGGGKDEDEGEGEGGRGVFFSL